MHDVLPDVSPKEYWDRETAAAGSLLVDHCHAAADSYVPESLKGFLLTEFASFYIVFRALIVRWIETLFVLSVAASSPIFFHLYRLPNGSAINYNQSWSMISIILVFPLTQSMSAAFARRERGIQYLQTFKSNCMSLLLGHRDWDWLSVNAKDAKEPPYGGRKARLKSGHAESVLGDLISLIRTVELLLLAPTTSHIMLLLSRSDVDVVGRSMRNLRRQVSLLFHQLSLHVEELKAAGLPANEATRIRQYFTIVIESYNQMLSIKAYHTPLGLRAFSRVFILLLPWLYGPYLGNLAASTGLAFAVTFSVVQSIALQSLFVIRFSLEDPFRPLNMPKGGHDAIEVSTELAELIDNLKLFVSTENFHFKAQEVQEQSVTIDLCVKNDGGMK